MEMIIDELVKNGIAGVFLLVLLYFSREVLLTVKIFLREGKDDKKVESQLQRELINSLMKELKTLHEEHRMHLIATQGQLIDVVAENSRAYMKMAESQLKIADGNTAVANAITNQNKLIDQIKSKSNGKDN